MMFVDASAVVAILTREAEADRFADIIEQDAAPIISPIAIFEAVAGIARKRRSTIEEAADDVDDMLAASGITPVAITPEDARAALVAFARYGKGRGHPAQLNLGDCFAYAVAMRYRTTLLFKGEDFARTDIRSANG